MRDLKIPSITEAFRYSNLVQSKSSTEDAAQERRQQQEQQKDRQKDGEGQEYGEAEVQAAVQSFEGDAQAQASGLQAEVAGHGPGLRVVLKDGTGAVLRQFTGEEFVKLRESVTHGTGRGKILDQKV